MATAGTSDGTDVPSRYITLYQKSLKRRHWKSIAGDLLHSFSLRIFFYQNLEPNLEYTVCWTKSWRKYELRHLTQTNCANMSLQAPRLFRGYSVVTAVSLVDWTCMWMPSGVYRHFGERSSVNNKSILCTMQSCHLPSYSGLRYKKKNKKDMKSTC